MPDDTRHIVIRGILVAETAISVGSGDSSAVSDNPVIRDFYDDPFIPGTSLAGVLRSTLDEKAAALLFGRTGKEGKRNDGEASRLYVSNAWLVGEGERPSWRNRMAGGKDSIADKLKPRILRDHVRIVHGQGSAAEGGKFDEEVIPRGTRFGFELEWRPLKDDQDQDAQKDALKQLLKALEAGYLRIGGSTTRGLGRVTAVQLDARILPKASENWLGHATLGLDHKFKDGDLPKWDYAVEKEDSVAPAWLIEVDLETDGPLLVGGGEPTEAADITCYKEPVWTGTKLEDRFVIPGSAFKGVLRHRAQSIAEAVFEDEATEIIADLFGPGPEAKADELKRGAVAVDDVLLAAKNEHTQVVPHVAIDRFTGGAVDGALYQEQPIWTAGPQTFKLRITVNPPSDTTLEERHEFVLAQALIDLAFGEIRIGHGTRRGNGIIRLQGGPAGIAPPAVGSTVTVWKQGERMTLEELAKLAGQLDEAAKAAGGAK